MDIAAEKGSMRLDFRRKYIILVAFYSVYINSEYSIRLGAGRHPNRPKYGRASHISRNPGAE